MSDDPHANVPKNSLAVVGMAGRYPGARNVEEFWRNLKGGVKSIRAVDDEELLAAGVSPQLAADPRYVKKVADLEGFDLFDAPFFGFTAREAESLDPQTRVFLHCAWAALEDAGYAPESFGGLVGVFAGKGYPAYMTHNLAANPEFVRLVGDLQVTIHNESDSLAPIVAYRMDLKGPSVSVQSFCSTSLLAAHLACQSLLAYECDIALAGGAAITIPHGRGYLYQEGGILSPDGECRSFDAAAAGSVIGSGAGVVALRRLDDALADGDHVYALIRGTATNNDGMLRVGYTAPGLNGQAAVILEALSVAGVDPATVGYVLTHGTGTPLGDSVELEAMMQAFSVHTSRRGFCAVGSIKPNVGHLDRASGVANLIAAALALHRRQLPPSLNFERTSAEIDLAASPFYVNTQLRDWATDGAGPRRAGTSSFGLGGTNVHMVLEEAPAGRPSGPSRPYKLLPLSARTAGALEIATSELAGRLQSGPEAELADVAFTLQMGRAAFNHRRVTVCSDTREAAEALLLADPRRVFSRHQTSRERAVAFLFPGVGDHYVGMGFGLYRSEPTFREWVDKCSEILSPNLKVSLSELLYPADYKPAEAAGGGQDRLRLMLARGEEVSSDPGPLRRASIAQPAVFVVEYALAQLLIEWGLRPGALAGYSLGEYTAACLAGVLSLEDALRLVAGRAALIETLEEGGMLAVALGEGQAARYLDAEVSLAAVLTADTCVLAGPRPAIDGLGGRLAAEGVACRTVPTTHALHSRMMEPIAAELGALLRTVRLSPPRIPYVSNLTGRWIDAGEATSPDYWIRHMSRPVRFADCVGTLLRDREQLLFEVGPGQSLTAFARQHRDWTAADSGMILPTLRHWYDGQHDGAFLLTTLGKAWLDGAQVDWAGFQRHESRRRVSLPTYPFEQQRYWVEAGRSADNPGHAARQPAAAKREILSDWFYLPTWKQTRLRRPADAGAQASVGGAWLFFMDEGGVGARLADKLAAGGRTVARVYPGTQFLAEEANTFYINPERPQDYQDLLAALGRPPGHVAHLWSLNSAAEGDDERGRFALAQRTGFYSLVNLIKALAGHTEPMQVWAVTTLCQSVTGAERLNPQQAPVGGVCRVIPQENLNITCQTIDLDDCGGDGRRSAWVAEQLAAELLERTDDLCVAYRGNTRWVQSFEPVPLERPGGGSAWRRGGVYLIVGGLGDVGMCVAEHLARTCRAKVLLTSRSAFPERADWPDWLSARGEDDPTSRRIRRFLEWEAAGGEVRVATADAADGERMAALLDEIDRLHGELHGVFYAAGVSGDAFFSPVQEITEEQCEAHFRSKVDGLYVLEEVLASRPLDCCVIFSSISSVLGGLGFSAYAAANRFLDTFTHRHNQRHRGWWTCVNWDTWRTREGMHESMGATVASFDMSPGEATESLERVILNQPLGQVVNSTGDLESRIDQWVRLLSARGGEGPSGEGCPLHPRPPLMSPYEPPTNETEKVIAEIWQTFLGFEPIGVNDNFLELGGHSLLATQIVSRLRQKFRVHLPLAILLMSPTVGELALAVELALIEEIEKLPDGGTGG